MAIRFDRWGNRKGAIRFYVNFTEGEIGMLNLLGYSISFAPEGTVSAAMLHGCSIPLSEAKTALETIPKIWVERGELKTFYGVEIPQYAQEYILEEYQKQL